MRTFTFILFLLLAISFRGELSAQTTYVLGGNLAPSTGCLGTDSEQYLGNGCWENDQTASYVEFYLDISAFGTFTIDDIDYVKYVTNKTTDQTKADFYLAIYTPKPDPGWPTWYGYRLNAEPYFSNNLNAPANQWNEWNTDPGTNQLTFFDSNVTGVGFGFYGQPDLQDLQAGPINWNSYYAPAAVTSIDYGAEEVLLMKIATGSIWNNVFDGYLDQIVISVSGSVVTYDLEGSMPEVWVDDDWAGSSPGDPVGAGHIFGNDAFANVQDGVDAVIAGGTVNVAAGAYHERINIGKSLDLIGPQHDVDPTPTGARTDINAEAVIDLTGVPLVNPNVMIEIPSGVTNVTISGFTLNGSTVAHWADESTIRTWDDNIMIRDNIIDGYTNILIKGNDFITIYRNRMITSKQCVVVQPNPASNISISDNSMTVNTTPDAGAQGVYMTGTPNSSVSGNTIWGFTDGNGIGGSNLTQLQISGNTLSGNRKGINFWGTTTYITIDNNEVTNSTVVGINIKGDHLSITNNDINNNATGITIDKHVLNTEDVTIYHNSFTFNTGYALEVTPAVVMTVDAEENYWGTVLAPEVVAKISGNADYVPWCNSDFTICTYTLPVVNVTQGTSYATIQEAVDAANAGDVIEASAGTYYENVVINKSLTLQTSSTPAIIDAGGTPSSSDITGINITASDVTVDGMTVINARGTDSEGIRIGSNKRGVTLQNCTVYNCNNGIALTQTGSGATNLIHQNTVYDIFNDDGYSGCAIIAWCNYAPSNNDIEITYNEVYNAARYGIIIGTNDPALISTNNTISNNHIHDNNPTVTIGINTLYGQNNIISDNTMSGNNMGIGIDMYSDNNLISGNYVTSGGDQLGIALYNGCSGNTISGNTLDNNSTGITLQNSSNGNTIDNNTVSTNTWWGIYLTNASDNIISNNDLSVAVANVNLSNSSNNTTIDGNTMTASGGPNILIDNSSGASIINNTLTGGWAGVQFQNSGSGSVHFNDISGNSIGVWEDGVSIDATGNWWGDATGPNNWITNPSALGNPVTDNVDYSPWWGMNYVGDPHANPWTWYSNDDITEAAGLASAGDVIRLQAMTYTGTAEVNKGLSIIGEDAKGPATIIDGGIFLNNDAEAINGLLLENLYIKGNAGSNRIINFGNSQAINDFSMDNCVVDGEMVDGRGGMNGNKLGGSFSITATEFKDIWNWYVLDMDGSYGGPPAGGNELPLTSITFANNHIHDCDGSTALRGNHSSKTPVVNVYGNTVENIGGHGTNDFHWAGIEINHAVQANIYNNTINNITLGGYGEGQGFQFWDIDVLDMHDNDITNCAQTGIFIFGGAAGGTYGGPYTVPGGNIYHNNISSNGFGIEMESACTGGPLDARLNWWGDPTGPFHPTLNAPGLGNGVSDNILFDPWYTDPGMQYTNDIDVGLYHTTCGDFEVRVRPFSDITGLYLTNLVFTVKWEGATSLNLENVSSDYQVFKAYDAVDGNAKYSVFIALPIDLTVNWTAGTEYVVCSFSHDQSLPGSYADFEIADDTWAQNNNAEYYIEIDGLDNTGLIYQDAPNVFLGSCDVLVKAFLQGPYNVDNHNMNADLCDSTDFPLTQPYDVAPWSYAGTESITAPVPSNVVDWVLVELRSGADPASATLFDRRAALLLQDGTIAKHDDLSAGIVFDNMIAEEDYYIVVWHRNHMPVLSGAAVTLPNTAAYDFTEVTLTTPYKHMDPLPVENEPETGVWALIAGDINSDGMLKYSGADNDRALIILRIFDEGGTLLNHVASGYFDEDVTMNYITRYTGGGNDRDKMVNSLKTASMIPYLNAVYFTVVPDANFTSKDAGSGNGPLNIRMSETSGALSVGLEASEQVEGTIDNVQFTLVWNNEYTEIEQMIQQSQSLYGIAPQGPAIVKGGMSYQVFVGVTPFGFSGQNDFFELVRLPKSNDGGVSPQVQIADDETAFAINGDFYVSVWGRDMTGEIQSTKLGAEEMSAEALRIYPNPVSDGTLNILLPDISGQEVQITLTGMQGQVVLEQNCEAGGLMQLDVSRLNGGVYLLKVEGENGVHNSRVVIR